MIDLKKKIVFQHNKMTGVTYAYENYPYWCKVKKQPRSKRKCIGQLCKETNTIVPNQPRGRHKRIKKASTPPVQTLPIAKRSFYGGTYLFDEICEKLNITDDLQACFPDTYKQILSIAYYLILEDNNPLSRFEKWGSLHKHPYGKDIPSQRSSELFASITEEAKTKFFKLQGKRRAEKEYWTYDITSISSYSETLRQVQYGHNKENDGLPHINLAMVFGEESGLPFYYRKLAGNIPDSKTVKRLLSDLSVLGFDKVKLVMDRAFHTEENINNFYKDRVKFLIGAKKTISVIKDAIDEASEELRTFENYNADYGYYGLTISTHWNYTQTRPNKGDTLKEEKRIYIHVYYNIEKAAAEELELDNMLSKLFNELQSGKRNEKNEKLYEKYFTVTETEKGIQVKAKKDVIQNQKKYFGYFALISNEVLSVWKALYLYKAKDIIEKAFGNIKERLNCRRTLVSSEKSLDGKFFVVFVGLIILSYINKKMRDKEMYKEYTLQQLLDKLDVIECFEYEGKRIQIGEVLEKQKKIYHDLEIKNIT